MPFYKGISPTQGSNLLHLMSPALAGKIFTIPRTVALCPWDSLGKNTGVDCHALLQGHLPNPGFEPAASHVSCIGRQDLYHKRDLWTDSTLGPGDVRQTKHLLPLGGSQF